MPSRSRSRSRTPPRRSRSRSRSRSRRREHSRSPMSSRRRHLGNREDPDPSKCLGIFGLSLYTTERELEAEFGKFGPMEKVNVVLDGHSGRSRGFAFIYYENIEDATEARNVMSGKEMDGRKIRVDYSITKRAHTPTPGMYMGRPTAGSSRRSPGRRRDGSRDRDYYARDDYYRRRSPSPYRRRRSPSPYGRRNYRSRSRSYSPRRYSPRRY